MPDELMYLLVHHLDGALAGGPPSEMIAGEPLLHSTLTWQVRTCQRARREAPTHLQMRNECSYASRSCFSTLNSGMMPIGTRSTGS